jgi:hypothetical protein
VVDVFTEDAEGGPAPEGVIKRYQAIRGVLYAFDDESEYDVSPASIQAATEVFRLVSSAIAQLKAEQSRTNPNRVMNAKSQLHSAIESGAARLADSVRPQLRSDVTDLGQRMLEVSEIEQQARAAKDEFQRLEGRAKEVIDRVGVGRFAMHYEQQAKYQEEAAVRWLRALAVTGVLLVGVVGWLIWEALASGGNPQSWETIGTMLATKALAIGVLSYAAAFCSKNYRAHRHMESSYQQRIAALDTYALMASSLSEDSESRAIVLTELARSAFAPTDTGLTSPSSGDRMIIDNSAPLVAAARPS